jgi:hypothetical protein
MPHAHGYILKFSQAKLTSMTKVSPLHGAVDHQFLHGREPLQIAKIPMHMHIHALANWLPQLASFRRVALHFVLGLALQQTATAI